MTFISEQRCIVCAAMSIEQKTPIEVAHVGVRGLGQKCSDRETLPICERHHQTGPLALHKLGKKFWTHFGIDKNSEIERLNAEYGQIENGSLV